MPTALHAIVQAIASTVPGAWLVARVLHHLDGAALRLSRGRWTTTEALTGLPVVFVTTIGAQSGLPRTLPLVPIRVSTDLNTFALIGTNFGRRRTPGWCYNLRAHPHAVVSQDGQSVQYNAHEAQGDEYLSFWQAAVRLYAGYAHYRMRVRRRVVIMVLTRSEGAR